MVAMWTKNAARTLPIAAALGTVLAASTAHAGPNDNSSSEPWSLHAGFGPMVEFDVGPEIHGRASFDMEYHFKGGDVGPALGFYVPQHFNAFEWGMTLGPIFIWDFRAAQSGNVKFYVGPAAATGYGFNVAGFDHFWFFYVTPHFRLLYKDFIGFFVRPGGEVWVGTLVQGHFSFITGLAFAF